MPLNPAQDEPVETPEQGKMPVRIKADLAPGTHLRLTVSRSPVEGVEGSPIPGGRPSSAFSRHFIHAALHAFGQRLAKNAGVLLVAAALAVYLATRLAGLQDFPVYFFTDEAVQTVSAADLVNNNLYSPHNEFLPTYFYNGYQYNLGLSVYWQVVPYLLFGKSVWVTRAASAFGSLLAALAVGLMLSLVFRKPYAWAGILLLSITPAWFLHSRTAFETSLAVSFYAVFLLCYTLYRTSSPRWLYAAILAAALAYYTYSPARMVTAVTALLLLAFDLRYHWQNRRVILPAVGLCAALALPQARFNLAHPNADLDHLRVLNSYWIRSIPVGEKALLFLREYIKGLNPFYWYQPNETDMIRHLMKGYGHINSFTIPLALTGLGVCIKNFRQPAYRVVLAGLLAAPSGAALVALGITRALAMVIPLALLSALGLAAWLEWAAKRWPVAKTWYITGVLFITLAGYNIFMAQDTLNNSPTWFTNYGLSGLQYGARQVSATIADTLYQKPNTAILLSPAWTNGTDTVMRFFFDDPSPFSLASVDGYIDNRQPLPSNTVFIMTPEELKRARDSRKFKDISVQKTLPYPNGQPGFYFVSLEYADNIDQVFALEKEQRRILQTATINIIGQSVKVDFSRLDIGKIEDAFDGSDQTLVRTVEANPFEIRLTFDTAQTLNEVALHVGGTPTHITAELVDMDGRVFTYNAQVPETPTPRDVSIPFGQAQKARSLDLKIKSVNDDEPAHVHVWEIKLK